MTTRTDLSASPLIESRDDLLSVFSGGEKPREDWRIGTEHEKFVYRCGDHRAPSWDEPGGIRDLLLGLTEFGWRPVEEGGKIIALTGADGNVSLEPAGQFELSGAPLKNLHQSCAESGAAPRAVQGGRRPARPRLPRARHVARQAPRPSCRSCPRAATTIMLRHMPRVGNLGLDMMLRTCTIQVNLDYASEADMVKKFRVGLALQPVATALFANSPFTEGKPNGYKSFRSHIWEDTDPHAHRHAAVRVRGRLRLRTLLRLCARRADVFRLPRRQIYRRCAGKASAISCDGKLPALPGEKPRLADWTDHLSTAFPEVRLKSFLEMRGADGGRWGRICALPALWVGLLYSRHRARRGVGPGQALDDRGARGAAPCRAARRRSTQRCPAAERSATSPAKCSTSPRPASRERAKLNAAGDNEGGFLDPLRDVVASGMTLADRLLDRYHGRLERRCQPRL